MSNNYSNKKDKKGRRTFLKQGTKTILTTAALSALPWSHSAFAVAEDEYEFIIVGAGAGGGPLAVNLARKGFSVLLIEAGSDRLPLSAKIPAYHTISTEDKAISWDFFVKHYDKPEMHAKWNYENEGVLYPRASVVGGCTAHNAMICMYPDNDDWTRIFKLTGEKDKSWHWQRMLSIFRKKIENAMYFADAEKSRRKGWHKTEMTPLNFLGRDPILKKIVLSAITEKGWYFDEILHALNNYSYNMFELDSYLDANTSHLNDSLGFFRLPKSTYLGKRFGVFELVMAEAKINKNLTILPHTLVKKIEFKRNQKSNELVATGVLAHSGERLYRAHQEPNTSVLSGEKFYKATNEVILCGGAFNTPQLLMLSGIGPADQYKSMSAEGVLDVEPKLILEGVGRNLQDRYEVSVVTELDKDLELLKGCKFSQDLQNPQNDKCLEEWLNESTRANSVYSSNGVAAAIKMQTSVAQRDKTDAILFGLPGKFKGYYKGYSKETVASKNFFTWAILKGHSRNRNGRVAMKTGDFRDTPDIHFKYFFGEGGEEDLQAVYEAVKRTRAVNRKTFGASQVNASQRSHNKPLRDLPGEGEIFPGVELKTESQVKSWIQREAWGHHASCSAKMGLDPKDNSVVDSNFKVHNTQNLRIVDASVFPEIPGLFIVLPIYMISEKASEVIIKKYKG